MTIYPRGLEPGATLGLVAPASPPREPSYIERVIAGIEARGFRVKAARHLRKRKGYLAGTDRERAADLMAMFLDARVDGVLCLRGGYGSGRILPLLDYKAIEASRKIFVGFSDITAVHAAIARHTRLVTFHGGIAPMFVNGNERAWRSFNCMTSAREAAGSMLSGPAGIKARCTAIRKGEARGRLAGGNLSILVSLLGTPYFPPLKGRILLIEDVGEAAYRIDRMLTQLLNAGVLQQVAGVAAGTFEGCTTDAGKQTVHDVLVERLRPLGVPVLEGLPVGHQDLNVTIPLGAMARLCAGARPDLIIEEAVLR